MLKPMTNHDRFKKAFENHRNEVLTTAQIRQILRRAFPHMTEGSALPNDRGWKQIRLQVRWHV